MGVVKRQGIKKSLVSYVGTAIGALSMIFVYPYDLELYGSAQFLIPAAMLLSQFFSFGIPTLTIRYFSVFENKVNGNNGFLGLLILGVTISFILVSITAALFEDHFLAFIEFIGMDREKYALNYWFLIVLSLIAVLRGILVGYCSNFFRITIPAIFHELLQKISLPILILLVYWNIAPASSFKYGILVFFILSLLLMIGYLIYLKQLNLKINWSFLNIPLLKRMFIFASYGIMGGVSAKLAFQIDSIMVPSYMEYADNGIYSINMFMSNMILIPLAAIIGIVSPIIARAWSKNSTAEILENYKRSSLLLTAVGIFIFLIIWINVDELYLLLPNGRAVSEGKYVFFFLGIGAVLNLMTGLNDSIIYYSKLFRFNLAITVLIGVCNIFLNIYLIPIYLIVGAAIATSISITMANIIKTAFVWYKFKMQPFCWNTIYLLFTGIFSYLVVSLIPEVGITWFSIIVKAVVFAFTYISIMIYFDMVPDATRAFKQLLIKLV